MSMFPISFTKYHGNGNDFIIFDLTKPMAPSLFQTIMDNAQHLCHRHRGIGADGVIMLTKTNAEYHMTVINADGSVAKNCGNGLRCLAAYLFKEHRIASPVAIMLHGQTYACSLAENEISVEMGQCRITDIDTIYLPSVQSPVTRALGSIGNDHVIILVQEPVDDDLVVADVRRMMAHADELNIGLISIEYPGVIRSRVFERGVGWTKSCGTGACIAASLVTQLFPERAGAELLMSQPGGDLSVQVTVIDRLQQGALCSVVLRGDAREIFTGICQQAMS